jgi:hypothetical protein
LKLKDVPADGNCGYYMYCIFAGWNLSRVAEMKSRLASYMEENRDIFKALQPQGTY